MKTAALLSVLWLTTLGALAGEWSVAVRVRGTVEVSRDGQSWESIIRNRMLGEQGLVRTMAEAVGQVRTAGGVCVLGPLTTVQRESSGLHLASGALRLEGLGRVVTRLGPLESQDPTTVCVLVDRGSEGLWCEVFDGWVRIQRSGAEPVDVDGGERAVWSDKGLVVQEGNPSQLPRELLPREDD